MSRYEKRLEIAMEERERLISDLMLANGTKEILEADLRRTVEELKEQEEKCDYLQKQLKILSEIESRKQEQHDINLDEIKDLRREINIAKEARIELQTDIKVAKQELKGSSDRELKLARTVETLKEREAELNTKLAISKEKERKLKELIEDLQPSLKAAVEKEEDIKDLKNKLTNTKERRMSTSYMRIKELNETIEKYAAEKHDLQSKLGRIREDKEMLTQRVKMLEGQNKKLKNTQVLSQQTVPIEKVLNSVLSNCNIIIIIIRI